MNFKLNYKPSDSYSAVTEQELRLKQLLSSEGIPFTFQQKFHLSNQWYIIDFFIANTILLECSATSMMKHDVALKQKALQLELKGSHLRKYVSHPIWVLFESQKPIGTQLLTTLHRLMPSVDRILTSLAMFFENLQGYFRNILNFSTSNQLKVSVFPKYSPRILPSNDYTGKFPHNQMFPDFHLFVYFDNGLNIQTPQKIYDIPLSESTNLINNYSLEVKEKFFERSEVFQS